MKRLTKVLASFATAAMAMGIIGACGGSSAPVQPDWTTKCVVGYTEKQFQLHVTNNSSAPQVTPGWTITLYYGGTVVGTVTDEGHGVLFQKTVAPHASAESNVWSVAGYTMFNSCVAS
jgi:hypothetical protein